MYSPADLNVINNFLSNPGLQIIFFLFAIWSITWKGFALWRAAKNGQRNWFIAVLLINTLGILEIVYLFHFSKPKKAESVQK